MGRTTDQLHEDTGPASDEARRDVECAVDATEEGVVGPREAGSGGAPAAPRRKGLGLTSDERFRSGRLAGLTMGSAIWVLSWPVLVESLLNSFVGVTDTWLASQIGVAEADAIGGASYINWFIGLTFMAIGIGATAMISRAVGMGRLGVAQATMGQSVLMAIVMGLFVGAGVYALAPVAAGLLNLDGAAQDAFTSYLKIIAIGVVPASVLFVLVACARGAGDSKRPLWAMGVRNAVNIFVSWALSGVDIAYGHEVGGEVVRTVLLQNPFPFELGVAGIAAGTVAGDLAGMLVVLRMALSGTWGITLFRRRLRPHRVTLGRLIRLAIPNYIETLGMWVGNFLIVIMVGWMGAGLLGAHIIAIRLESLSFLPGFAMGTAAATLAGQYIGAGRADLARRSMWRCAVFASAFMGVFGACFVLTPEPFVGAMSAQAVHLDKTPMLLVICGWVQVPFALGIVFRGGMRGAGDVRFVMGLTWTTTYLVRLPLAFLLSGVDIPSFDFGAMHAAEGIWIHNPMPDDFPISGIWGLWIGLCFDIVLRAVVYGARFVHGGWTRAKV